MTRLDEVEAEIDGLDVVYSEKFYTGSYADLARTLAAEVDLYKPYYDAIIDMAVSEWTLDGRSQLEAHYAIQRIVLQHSQEITDPLLNEALAQRDAEIAELRRRLERVITAIPTPDLESGQVFCIVCNELVEPCAMPDLQGDYCAECEEQAYSPFNDEEACAVFAKLIAIAEGRDNG